MISRRATDVSSLTRPWAGALHATLTPKTLHLSSVRREPSMALSPEFREFYFRWREKAQTYQSDLQQSFDKFFTLYVLFNRLYTEATFRLVQTGRLKIMNRNRFPDARAAQEYVVQYLGAKRLLRELHSAPETREALGSIRTQVCGGSFWFKLDFLTGDQQPDLDRDLCRRLANASSNTQAAAVLETLYAIRCNMFHGRKGFHPVQQKLLNPVNLVLERIIEILYEKLNGEDG